MDEWQKKVAAMKAARQTRQKAPSFVGSKTASTAAKPSTAAKSSAGGTPAARFSSAPEPAASTQPSVAVSSPAGPTRATPAKAPAPERVSAFGSGGLSPTTTRSPARTSGIGGYKSGSPAPANGAGSDFKALYEAELAKRQDAEAQALTREKECAMLKQKLVDLSGTDLAKQVVASGGSVSRELNLVKTELKVTKMKYDSEVRKREALERDLDRQKEEVASLKRKGSAARQMVDRSRKDMEMSSAKRKIDLKANRMKMQADRLAQERGLDRPGSGSGKRTRQSVRQSKRMTRAPKMDIVAMVTRVLAEMEKLEKNIKTAEAGRMQAESELLEVAMYKQASDDALGSIANDMRLHVVFFAQHIGALQTIAKSSADKDALEAVIAKLEKLKGDMEKRLTERNVKKSSNDAAEMNKRASVYATQLNLPPPPPTSGFTEPGPRGPSGASRPAVAAPSALLDQIRRGKDLNRINVDALKAERAQNYRSNRKSMALLASLQDTLRDALNNRREDLEAEDYGDDDEWEEWDEN